MRKVSVILGGIMVLTLILTGCGKKAANITPSVQQKTTENKVQAPVAADKKPEFEANPNHPVVLVFKYGQDDFNFANVWGGSKNGKWLGLGDFNVRFKGKTISYDAFRKQYDYTQNELGKSDMIKGDEIYKFYSSDKLITQGKSTGQEMSISPANVETFLSVDFKPIKTKENFLIGINGAWNALPRTIKKLSQKDSYSIDIEGDGVDEIIRVKTAEIQKKGYEDKLYTAIEKSIYLEKDKRSLLVEKFDIEKDVSNNYEISALDLNGDGKMEVVVKVSYGYGENVSAHELSNNAMKRIFDYYDGD